MFLYKNVLHQPLPESIAAVRAKRSHYLPTVLTPEEAKSVIQQLSGEYRLITEILYGSGLRLREAMELRVKDLDFAQQQINILEAKGRNSGVTMMPSSIIERLQEHLVGSSSRKMTVKALPGLALTRFLLDHLLGTLQGDLEQFEGSLLQRRRSRDLIKAGKS